MSDDPPYRDDIGDMTEEQLCQYHIDWLRRQYEREAKPYFDRLAKIKMREMPMYIIPEDTHT